MPENLDLPPDVRAVQADMLRPLDFRPTCNECEGPAAYGARRSCCKAPVVWCLSHCRHQLNEITGARVAGYGLVCPDCGCVFHPPVRPMHLFEHDINLITTNFGG